MIELLFVVLVSFSERGGKDAEVVEVCGSCACSCAAARRKRKERGRKKVRTTPGIPTWSPTVVLTGPDDA